VTEVFPEQNFLYRRGTVLDAERYGGRGRFGRLVGRLICYPGTRSSQIVQVAKLVKDLRAARPGIVVGWGHEISMITFVAAAIARVPHVVFCIRTFNPSFGWTSPWMGRLLHAAHRRMLPYVSAVVVNSTPLRRDYAKWAGVDEGRISVCPNGIDAAVFSLAEADTARRRIRERYGVSPEALLIIHVGRFSAEKGQMSLMQANVELLKRYSERHVAWLLCGDGPTMSDVRQYAVAHGFENVVFAGRVDDVRDCLLAADIFVMPSDFEGMPNAMMEAMAQGLPAVSTDRSGSVDIARDGVEALYYAPGDVARLVAHLATLLDQPGQRRQLGLRAQQRMREFSVSRAVEIFDGTLMTRCGGASSPAHESPPLHPTVTLPRDSPLQRNPD
jgi:glycosyltransferase involved in cell wall biosynthesis